MNIKQINEALLKINRTIVEGKLNMSLAQELEGISDELKRFNQEGIRDIAHLAKKKVIDPKVAKRIIKNAKELYVDVNILLDLNGMDESKESN